jgi:type I restriction enzyme S subunit
MSKLGDYVEQIRGVSYTPADVCIDKDPSAVPLLRANNIQETLNLDDLVYVKRNRVSVRQLIKAGDILVCASSGSKHLVGKAVQINSDMEMSFGAFCKLVRCRKGALPKYMGHFFHSPKYRKLISALSEGANINNIRNEHIDNLEIDLPLISAQNDAVVRLDKAFELILKRRKQLSALDTLIKSQFIELFGDPVRNEKGLPLTSFSECCIINPHKSDDKRLTPDLEVSFIPMNAVSENGQFDLSATRMVEQVKTGFTYFAENDILFAKITPCMENGKGGIAKNMCNGVGFGSTEFHVIRPIEGVTNPYWIYQITVFEEFRKTAAANMTGSAGQRRVPASYLEKYTIGLPSIEAQTRFAEFVQEVDKSKFKIQQSLKRLETCYKALMQEYFG